MPDDFWAENKPGALRRLGEQAKWWDMPYRDWLDVIDQRAPDLDLLDVGCGFGQFVKVARSEGWRAYGIEPSAYAHRRSLAPPWVSCHRWEAVSGLRESAICAMWLMEHLENIGEFLWWARSSLAADGILLAVVPNEGTRLQMAANTVAAKKGWWIDSTHLNYWGQASFHALLDKQGFDVVDELGTYPMEEFILAGMDYTNDPEVGKACHKRVEDTEMAMTREERLRVGRERASRGEGRGMVVFARKL